MKRIFIAIKIDPGPHFMRLYTSLKSILGGERINWTDPSNIHLTLAFLGDTEDDLIKIVSIMLKQKCTGFGEFSFLLKGTRVFRDYRDPRVIWTGVEECEKLAKLNSEINNGLKDAGFRNESRPFSPHITLGRIKLVKNRETFKASLEKYKDTAVQEVAVKEVILYESILKPSGPVYRVMGKFIL